MPTITQLSPLRRPEWGVVSEYGRLRDVAVYLPDPSVGLIQDPEAHCHRASVDYLGLVRQFRNLVDVYRSLGVTVHINSAKARSPFELANYQFQRDTFFMTPFGAIVANMAHGVRRREREHTVRFLRRLGVKIAHVVQGGARLEGADCLWVSPDLVLVGLDRTNAEGFAQLQAFLAPRGVVALGVPLKLNGPQHLLGVLQILAPGIALARTELLTPGALDVLKQAGLDIVPVPESAETRDRLGFNFVTLGAGDVAMPEGCPGLGALLRGHGIRVQATLPVSEYIAAAGGLACATGILNRDPF